MLILHQDAKLVKCFKKKILSNNLKAKEDYIVTFSFRGYLQFRSCTSDWLKNIVNLK